MEPPFAGLDSAINFVTLGKDMQEKLFWINTTTSPRHVIP